MCRVRWGRILWFLCSAFEPVFSLILFSVCCLIGAVAWRALGPSFVIFVLYVGGRIFFNPVFCVLPDWSSGVAWCALRPYFRLLCSVFETIFSLILFSVCRLQWFLYSTFETVFSLILFSVSRLILAVADALFWVLCALRLRLYFLSTCCLRLIVSFKSA